MKFDKEYNEFLLSEFLIEKMEEEKLYSRNLHAVFCDDIARKSVFIRKYYILLKKHIFSSPENFRAFYFLTFFICNLQNYLLK